MSESVLPTTSRRNVLQLALASIGAAAFGPALAACGSGGAGGGGAATADEITVGTAVDVINFDPYAQTTNALLVLRLLNCWLLTYDEDLNPVPDALESYEIAQDRASVTLSLRSDVVFSTGKTMTADDVVAAFERARDPELGANLAGPSAIIAGVEATDESTVVLTMVGPTDSGLIEDLLVGQPVVDSTRNTAEGLTQEPASAGPYTLAEWRPGEQLTLEAAEDWYGGEVAVPRVIIRVYTDTNAMVSGLSSGAIDLAVYVPPRDASRLQEDFTVLDGFPGAATMLLRVSTKTAPFGDKLLRQALQHCVDRDRIVQDVLFGFGGPAKLPWGPESPAQTDQFDDALDFDLDKARDLLEQTDQRTGSAMVNGSDPISLQVMQIIQADLETIGFTLDIERVDAAAFQDRLVAGDFGLVLGQMGGGQLSLPRVVQNSLFRLADNPLWTEGVPPPAYVEAMQTLTTESDEAVQEQAFVQLNQVVVDESWAIGTYYVPTLFIHKSDLEGVARDHQNALVLTDATF